MKNIIKATALLFCSILPANADTINAHDVSIIDGQTISYKGKQYQLLGFDVPHLNTPKCNYAKTLGHTAAAALKSLVNSGHVLDLYTNPNYGMYEKNFASLYVANMDVAQILINKKLALPYDGGERKCWCC